MNMATTAKTSTWEMGPALHLQLVSADLIITEKRPQLRQLAGGLEYALGILALLKKWYRREGTRGRGF
jgi:hypothetical protein